MKVAVWRLLLVVVGMLSLTACTTVEKPIKPMMNAVDRTMGSYDKNQGKELILLTMENAVHSQLSQAKPINQPDNLPAGYRLFLQKLADQYGLEWVADWPLSSLGIRCFVFRTDTPLQETTLEQLAGETYVETVQELQIFNTLSSVYNDPLVDLQESFSTMDIEPSHKWVTGKGVKVAVIDTGVDIKHPDLKNRVKLVQNFVDKSQSKFEQDIHGTAITGIIASNANNSEGMVGVAPESSIYALKSCWHDSQNYQDAYCNSFTLAKALDRSISLEVDLINLSLAGPTDVLLQRLIEKALEKNIIVVGAVHPDREQSFPTNIAGVIAATEKKAQPADGEQQAQVLYAAGDRVISTTPNNKYDFYSGSSISTAHVTGIVALIRQRKPHLSHIQINELLSGHQTDNNQINACNIISSLVGAERCN